MERDTAEIWNAFSGKLRGFLYRSLGNPADVDDVLQDVFVKVHRHAAELGSEAHLSGWVFTLARNAAVDFRRRRRGTGSAPEAEEEAPAEREPDLSTHSEIAGGLRELIAGLPEKYARALVLVDLEGKPFQEAARALGLSVSGAKSRVQRGRAMVRDALMRCCHFVLDRYGIILDAERACCCCAPAPARTPPVAAS